MSSLCLLVALALVACIFLPDVTSGAQIVLLVEAAALTIVGVLERP